MLDELVLLFWIEYSLYTFAITGYIARSNFDYATLRLYKLIAD